MHMCIIHGIYAIFTENYETVRQTHPFMVNSRAYS